MRKSLLIREVDALCSSFVIARDRRCVTSGALTDLTCSHLYGRSNKSVRWVEMNLFCQSMTENRNHDERNPESPLFKVFRKRYGARMLASLEQQARHPDYDITMYSLLKLKDNWQRKLDRILRETNQGIDEIQAKKWRGS